MRAICFNILINPSIKHRDNEQCKEISQLKETIKTLLLSQCKSNYQNYQENASIYSVSNNASIPFSFSNGGQAANGPVNSNMLYQRHQHQHQLQHTQATPLPMNNVMQHLKKPFPTSSSPLAYGNHVLTTRDTMTNAQDPRLFDELLHNSLLFGAINRPTPMLDNGPAKCKSLLVKRSSLATRQLPLQQQMQSSQCKKMHSVDQER